MGTCREGHVKTQGETAPCKQERCLRESSPEDTLISDAWSPGLRIPPCCLSPVVCGTVPQPGRLVRSSKPSGAPSSPHHARLHHIRCPSPPPLGPCSPQSWGNRRSPLLLVSASSLPGIGAHLALPPPLQARGGCFAQRSRIDARHPRHVHTTLAFGNKSPGPFVLKRATWSTRTNEHQDKCLKGRDSGGSWQPALADTLDAERGSHAVGGPRSWGRPGWCRGLAAGAARGLLGLSHEPGDQVAQF